MAYAKPVHYNHLVSWNIKGEGPAQERKKAVSTYLSALRPSPDILFLQEVQWAPPNLRTHLSALSDCHDLRQYSQEYANCYNCVIFDQRKFEVVPGELEKPLIESFKLLDKRNEWEKKDFRSSQEKQMRNRMCVVVLVAKSEGYKFIAASLHNLNNKQYSTKMAELFLQLLALLGDVTGYPVVLAGDFNANIHKSSEVIKSGFTIPEYKPTIHRLNRKSPIDTTIDFFLYRAGKDGTAVLHNVKADIARNDVVDSRGIIDDKVMDELHKVSNHDPLRATLQLSRTTGKVITKSSASAAAALSKRPASSKPVVKSTLKTSPPTSSTTAVRVKHETTTAPKSKPSSAKTTAATRAPPKPAQSSVKPSAGHTTAKIRACTSAKTKRSGVTHK